jgi:hypothetical protein
MEIGILSTITSIMACFRSSWKVRKLEADEPVAITTETNNISAVVFKRKSNISRKDILSSSITQSADEAQLM